MNTIVALEKCMEYSYEDVKRALRRAVSNIGGFEKYIKKGSTVLLKTNLLTRKKPEAAVTTHPVFVRALAELLTAYGCSVIIGDSPGGPFTEGALRGIYRTSGIEGAAAESGAKLNYNVKAVERENPDGLILKKVIVCDMLNDADYVISVAKLKTHAMMTFTGAVKNMFGAVPGIRKAEFHMNMFEYGDFANALVDICLSAKPVLSFMDGIDCMEGNGPAAGTVRKAGAVLASASPYHLDKIACAIAGIPLDSVPTIQAAAKRGLCAGDLTDIELTGEPLTAFEVKRFRLPDAQKSPDLKRLPKAVQGALNTYLKPKVFFDRNCCVGCKICAENCPVHVIEMKNEKPFANNKKCIRCYCCQELCPQKCVSVKRPALLNLFTEKVES